MLVVGIHDVAPAGVQKAVTVPATTARWLVCKRSGCLSPDEVLDTTAIVAPRL